MKKANPTPPGLELALNRISEASLRANLSFLASDALAGRFTPSPGLEAAAEFIASRFRAVPTLEPANGDSYFQLADLTGLLKESHHGQSQDPGRPVVARNVAALLRGADPLLKDSYVIVSAHYDHLGTLATSGKMSPQTTDTEGDRIFNGANDDGSGTVSVIEIATALAQIKRRPARSILFITFCGEELGLLGSTFYTQHPLYPLEKTIADINLEQVGRSDGDLGRNRVTMTGYDFTDLKTVFEAGARLLGLDLIKTKETATYFVASDNYSFAKAGVPDLTLATSFEFPDYHRVKDEWQKIDFPAMVKIDRLVAAAVWELANRRRVPEWNPQDQKTERFRNAKPERTPTLSPTP